VLVPAADDDRAGHPDHGDGNGGDLVEGPVAALPGASQPPAPRRAVAEERACELVTSRNLGRGGEAADRDENRGVVQGPVAELPELVMPDAFTVPSGRRTQVYSPPAEAAMGVMAPFAVNCCV